MKQNNLFWISVVIIAIPLVSFAAAEEAKESGQEETGELKETSEY